MLITRHTNRSRDTSPFYSGYRLRNIVITSGEPYPVGDGDDYVLPIGVPMAPVGTTGRYGRIACSTLATALASNDTQCYLNCVDGFATGDVVNVLSSTYAVAFTFAVTGVDYDNNILSMAAIASAANTGMYVERAETGYGTGGTFDDDCVILACNVQTRDEDDNDVVAEAIGVSDGQVEIADLTSFSPNFHNDLIELMLPRIEFIPQTPGT